MGMAKLSAKQRAAANYLRVILAVHGVAISACIVVGGLGLHWGLAYLAVALFCAIRTGKEEAKAVADATRLGALMYFVMLVVSAYKVFRCLALNSSACGFLYAYAAMLLATGAAIGLTVRSFWHTSKHERDTKKRLASHRKLDGLDLDKLKAMAKTPDKAKAGTDEQREKNRQDEEAKILEGLRERRPQDKEKDPLQ